MINISSNCTHYSRGINMKSTIKQRLQDKVTELSTKSFLINDNAHLLQDMTHEMFTKVFKIIPRNSAGLYLCWTNKSHTGHFICRP